MIFKPEDNDVRFNCNATQLFNTLFASVKHNIEFAENPLFSLEQRKSFFCWASNSFKIMKDNVFVFVESDRVTHMRSKMVEFEKRLTDLDKILCSGISTIHP